MQVMPFHPCVSFEPKKNIRCGTHILAGYLQRANLDTRAGLAAYNAGTKGRDVYGRGWEYADKVIENYEIFRR
jgi:soluble lytic murein transglycosylase-like protein